MKNPRRSITSAVIPASALMLGMSHAATIGINWTTSQTLYGAPPGAVVTSTAFGTAPADWSNVPSAASGSATMGPSGGVSVNWSNAGSWGSGIGGGAGPTAGDQQVFAGYLDDGGISVTVSGLSSIASSYSVKLLAASDFAPNGFFNATLGGGLSGSMAFTNIDTGFGYGGQGRTAATAFSSTGSADSFTISLPPVQLSPRIRGTLAGFVIDYTPIPEPATAASLVAVLGMAALRRRRS